MDDKTFCLLKNLAPVTLTLPQILDHKFVQDIVTLNICAKLYNNLSINKGARGTTKLFSKNSNCELDLEHTIVQNTVILNIQKKLY